MGNSLEGSIEGLVFGADLIRFKGVYVKRQKIQTKEINLIAYEWRFCGVIWNVSKEKRAGSKIILCLYSLVKILHSLYGSTQLASSMRTNIMKCFVSSSTDFFLNLRRFLTFWNLQMMSIWVQVFISKRCHNKKWKEVKKQFQFADSLDSFSASLCNSDLQFLSNLKEKNTFFLHLMCLRMHIFSSLKYLATIHDYLFFCKLCTVYEVNLSCAQT